MKKQHEKIGLFVVALAGILLASGPSFGQACPGPSNPNAVKVSVGYALTPFTPSPWLGSPGVIFIGTSTNWDAGAIKLDNPSNQPLTVDSVTVDIGPTLGINPWSPVTPICIPARGTAILTQTAFFNFDTSDIPTISCTPDGFIPVVHVTVGANNNIKSFKDTGQVLNTGGVDAATCGGTEGHAFVEIHP